MWCKQANFENTLQVPLFLKVPWLSPLPKSTSQIVELIDLLPTLVSLASLPLSNPCMQGTDLSPLLMDSPHPLRDSQGEVKNYAISQYPRCRMRWDSPDRNPWNNPCTDEPLESIQFMAIPSELLDGGTQNGGNGTALNLTSHPLA